MKELSIEEKAKAYDEALEKASCYYDGANGNWDMITMITTMFPELKESEDDKVRKKLIHLVKKSHEQGGYALHKWESDEMLAWLEKQGEHTDKIEPKFHEGDWVVSDKNNVVRIKSIDSNYYVLENTMRFTIDYVDKCWHLWSIQDAKDGCEWLDKNGDEYQYKAPYNYFDMGKCIEDLKKHFSDK